MNKLFIFISGAAIGSLATWKIVKDHYERVANEEIESVKEVFESRLNSSEEETTEDEDEDPHTVVANNASMKDYAEQYNKYKQVISSARYSNEEGDDYLKSKPYVISPDEFGEDPNRKTVSLTYYADDILTDEENCIIDPGEIEDMIGEDSLTHFGEYEDDSVFVRNEELNTDYEILKDERSYTN